jgi:hypothetical protein
MLINIAEDVKLGVDSLYEKNRQEVLQLYTEADEIYQKSLTAQKTLAAAE